MRCHCDTRTCWPCYRLGRPLTQEVTVMLNPREVEAEAKADAFDRFCDFNGLDPSDQLAADLFEDYLADAAEEDGLEREAARFDREGWYGREDGDLF